MLRLAFTGNAFNGKSTSTDYILNKISGIELYFAESLKKAIIEVLQLDEKEQEYFYNPKLKEVKIPNLDVTSRKLCRTIGTELFRTSLNKEIPELKLEGKTVWIHSVSKKITKHQDKNIIVSDCRFDDESEFLKEKQFTIIKITNPRIIPDKTHASECGCKFDIEIINDGTLQELYNKLDILMLQLKQ